MDIEYFSKKLTEFRDKRDRKQFHNPKDLATAIAIEAGELQERFLRKSQEESYKIGKNESEVADEAVDILNFLLLFVDACGIDLKEAFDRKMAKNEKKYSPEKAKGKSDKYDQL